MPIQQQGARKILKYSLTIPELFYLAFTEKMLKNTLDQQANLFFLGTSEEMQREFREWVKRVCTVNKFTAEDLNLATIVSSIWKKTKLVTENELQMLKDQQAIKDEQKRQQQADEFETKFRSDEMLGKMLTERQARFLLRATDYLVETLGKPNKN